MNQKTYQYGLFGGLALVLLSFFLPVIDWTKRFQAFWGDMVGDDFGYSAIQYIMGSIPADVKDWMGDAIADYKFVYIVPIFLVLVALLLVVLYKNKISYIVVTVLSAVQMMIYSVNMSLASDNVEGFDLSATDILQFGFWLFMIGSVLECGAAIMSLLALKGGKDVQVIQEAVNVINNIPKAVEALGVGSTGSVTGISGVYSGSKLDLKMNEQIMIGRDSSECNLIIVAPKVSRKHCLVQYLGAAGYKITDFSSNGTFTSGGNRLPKNHPTVVPAGTVLSLGNQENTFQLG